jgi:hypothetical protein
MTASLDPNAALKTLKALLSMIQVTATGLNFVPMVTTQRTSHAANESTNQERKRGEDGEGGRGFA